MSDTILIAVISALGTGGVVGVIVNYLSARRTTTGNVGASDAKTIFDGLKDGYSKLIADSLTRIDDYKKDLDDMRSRLVQAEAEIEVLREQAHRAVELEDDLQKADALLTEAKASNTALQKQIAKLQAKSQGKPI